MILFPCNQFMRQEPGAPPTADKMKRMSTGNFSDDVLGSGDIVMTEKVEVNGGGSHPVWEFLKYNSSLYNEVTKVSTPIPWNFAKFLVEPTGGVYKYYSPNITPMGLKQDIDLLMSSDSPKSPTRRRTLDLSAS